MVAAIRGLKSKKAVGEDKIQPEMLTAFNHRVRLLIWVCQVA